jgi:hypothetical protein
LPVWRPFHHITSTVLEMQSQILNAEQRKSRIHHGLAWLKNSGIQEPANNPDAGGVHAWLDASTGQPAYLYSEITGYFITFCVQMQRHSEVLELSADEKAGLIERARAAADWILRVAQHESGAVLSRKYSELAADSSDPWSFAGGRVAFFDCAMVGFGLTELYALTSERRWLDAALRIGQYLLSVHESADKNTRYAASDVHTRQPLPEAPRWSQHFGPYELKSAHFLCSLSEVTGAEEYRRLLDRVLARALESQRPSGRFSTHPKGIATHLHPHSYTIEGLLYLVAKQGRRDLLQRAERAIDWMFQTCLLTASPVEQWSSEPALAISGTRSDALAQALRAYEIAKILEPSSIWSDWEPHLPTLYERVCNFATEDGGTTYGLDEAGDKSHHKNAWAHFFRMEMELFALLRQSRVAIACFALT